MDRTIGIITTIIVGIIGVTTITMDGITRTIIAMDGITSAKHIKMNNIKFL